MRSVNASNSSHNDKMSTLMPVVKNEERAVFAHALRRIKLPINDDQILRRDGGTSRLIFTLDHGHKSGLTDTYAS